MTSDDAVANLLIAAKGIDRNGKCGVCYSTITPRTRYVTRCSTWGDGLCPGRVLRETVAMVERDLRSVRKGYEETPP